MIVPKYRHIKSIVPYFIGLLLTGWLVWWTLSNPLPDGYQNEYLHVGNTFDLYDALVSFDWWHVRWYAYTSYWPWGFYAVPMVFLLPFGKSILWLIISNVLYLWLLIWSMVRLSVHFKSPLALYLLLLSPATFGSMTRFEPNFANMAMMAFGLLCLIESDSFRQRSWGLWFGLGFGVALMLDRLTMLFYLGPAALYVLSQVDWRVSEYRRTVGYSIVILLLCTVAYYREFIVRHSSELLSQAPVGEIDSAGELLLSDNPLPSFYYVLSLLDSQAGWGIGLCMLCGLGWSLWKRESVVDWILCCATLPGVLFFTWVAKKQVYYTFPILVPLSLLAGRFQRLSWLGIGGGMLLFLQQGLGVVSMETTVQPKIPSAYVAPSYLLARPPSQHSYAVEDLVAEMPNQPSEVIVFSEDQGWYEGFVVLQLRQYLDGHIRGLTADPIGVWEFSEQAEYLIWVHPASVTGSFPSSGSITTELVSDHYDLNDLPPVSNKVADLASEFALVFQWESREDGILSLYKRKSSP